MENGFQKTYTKAMHHPHPYDRSKELHTKTALYQKTLTRFILEQIKEDCGEKDLTTALLKNLQKKIRAVITAKQDGMIAGVEEILWTSKKIGLKAKPFAKDGDMVQKGQKICVFEGSVEKILGAERTLLNIMQRMSGIATVTNRLSQKIKKYGVRIAGTRKTPLGLIDKKAIAVGGGLTHRLSLNDGILIKNTHWLLQKQWPVRDTRFYGIEIRTEKELQTALALLKKLNKKTLKALLIDNQKPLRIKKLLKKIPKTLRTEITCEASGGITEKNIMAYAQSGVDILSLGALTHSVKALDLSLKIIES